MHPVLSIVTALAPPHQCVPGVAPGTSVSIAKTESGLHALAMHDKTFGMPYAADTLGAALATDVTVAHHQNIRLGVMHPNSANLQAVGVPIANAFDASGPMRAGSGILARGQRPSLRRIPPLSAFSHPRIFSLDDRSPRLDRSPDRIRAELNQGLICKQNVLCISGKAGLAKGNGFLDGSADELRAVLAIAKGLIQALNSRSIQPQRSFDRQTFWACHAVTIRRGCISLQTDTSHLYERHLLLSYKVPPIRIQLMAPVFRFRPFSRRESAPC